MILNILTSLSNSSLDWKRRIFFLFLEKLTESGQRCYRRLSENIWRGVINFLENWSVVVAVVSGVGRWRTDNVGQQWLEATAVGGRLRQMGCGLIRLDGTN